VVALLPEVVEELLPADGAVVEAAAPGAVVVAPLAPLDGDEETDGALPDVVEAAPLFAVVEAPPLFTVVVEALTAAPDDAPALIAPARPITWTRCPTCEPRSLPRSVHAIPVIPAALVDVVPVVPTAPGAVEPAPLVVAADAEGDALPACAFISM
jgi:hypothetical protein